MAWKVCLSMKMFGYKQSQGDHTLFIKHSAIGRVIVLLVYVDDIIVTKNNEEALYEGIKKMISDKNIFDYYRKQAKVRGNRFSTDETVKAVEKMLEELIEA